MNSISNIWNHPKTSAAGLLIAIATIAGTLSQQGVTLGSAGTGTVVTIVSAIATALLGLLAQDPMSAIPAVATSTGAAGNKLGAWALIALLIQLPFMSGCSGVTVAQDIVNWAPTLQSAVATVDTTAALLAPADAPVFAAATVGFDAASNVLVVQAKAYLANPGASTLAQLQDQVVTFQQQVNAALLKAGKILDPASQQHAVSAIQAVATIVSAMLSLVQSVSSKAAVAGMAARSTLKMASVERYMDVETASRVVAGHYGEPVAMGRMQVVSAERNEVQAGF
jgi:hypothetical protein